MHLDGEMARELEEEHARENGGQHRGMVWN